MNYNYLNLKLLGQMSRVERSFSVFNAEKLYKGYVNMLGLPNKRLENGQKVPEFIYIKQSNSNVSFTFPVSAFKYHGSLYTVGRNIIKDAINMIEIYTEPSKNPREFVDLQEEFEKNLSLNSPPNLPPNNKLETKKQQSDQQNYFWLEKNNVWTIFLDLNAIFGEDYNINPAKYGENDLILPLYQKHMGYDLIFKKEILNELKTAYCKIGFSNISNELEKQMSQPRSYCNIV